MFKSIRQIFMPLLILACGVGGLFWLSSRNQPPGRVVAPTQVPLVETQPVEKYEGALLIRTNGVVVPFAESRVSVEVTGRIVERADQLRGGRFVSAGTVLLKIDPEPFELELEKLDRERSEVSAELRRISLESDHTAKLQKLAEQRLRIAQRERDRIEGLIKQNVANPAQRDVAELAVLVAQSAHQELVNLAERLPIQSAGLKARSDVIESRQQIARRNLGLATIVCDRDGFITNEPPELGDFVNSGDVVATLLDPDRSEVECRVRMEELLWFWNTSAMQQPAETRHATELPELAAEVTFEVDGESFTWPGRVSRRSGTGFDADTRSLPLRVQIDQPARASKQAGPPTLIVGMFVDVKIPVAPSVELLSIPRSALQPDGTVWTVVDGRLQMHTVRIAKVGTDTVQLRAKRCPLGVDDRVVVSTLPMAFDGMVVRERLTP